MELNKTTFRNLSSLNGKKFVLFGSGHIAGKTIRNLNKEDIDFIVDNSSNLQGTKYKGFKVKSPEKILNSKNIILICSTAVSAISEQLKSLGFSPNIDFFISPIINDLLAVEEMENIKSEFYFTSGTPSTGEHDYGGGLYKANVDRDSVSLEKIYSGPCYGALSLKDKIYFVDTDSGIFSLSKNGKLNNCTQLPAGARAHGISYNSDNKNFYVTCSYLDSILEYSNSFELLNTFNISNKIKKTNEPMHHCNDNFSIGNSLYVSMFSSSGNWKFDKFDGCIAEFDITTKERLDDVEKDLYMPHNVQIIDGSLHVLDSLPGHLRFGNLEPQATFPAFSRGLATHGKYYYIGQSKNRNYSRVIGLSNSISIDCGVIIWDPEIKVSRFLKFPNSIGEIHSIVF